MPVCNYNFRRDSFTIGSYAVIQSYTRPTWMTVPNRTSGPSNLTTGRIAAALGRFTGILPQVALLYTTNTCFTGPIPVQIPNCVSIGSAVFAQLTAESRYTSQRAASFPLNWLIPTTWSEAPHLIHLIVFSLDFVLSCVCQLVLKNYDDDDDDDDDDGCMGPPKTSTQTASRWFAVFAGLTTVTDRPTDRQTDHRPTTRSV